MKRENVIKCLLYCRSLWLASTVSLLMCATYPSIAISQPPDEPIPVLDFGQSEKAISVTLTLGSSSATLDSVNVFRGRAHGRIGNPPLLGVQLLDLSNNVIDSFNAWNPRYVRVYNAEGRDSRAILPEGTGTGSIIFPFSPNVATMAVKNKEEHDSHIISVDLVPSIHAFCRDNRDDSDCGNVANRVPVCNAGGPYQVECGGQTTNVALNGTGSSDPDSDPLTYAWTGPFGTVSGASPTVQFGSLGTFNVNLGVSDDFGGSATCGAAVAVVDTTPPTFQGSSVRPNVLWPPEHQMVPVTITVVSSDICDSAPVCRIVSVSSNEPVNGLGDGDMAPDWIVTGALTVNLRAERSGTGNGRFYTITVFCTDATGNSAPGTAIVKVPHH